MVDTTRAERFYADSKTIAVEDVPIPEPGSGEVLADAVSTPCGAAPVIAVDIKPEVLDRAVELGADYAFDAVGLKSTFEQALDSVTVGGRLVGVGMSAESPSVGPTSTFGLTQKHVLGHLGYQNVDIETLATLVSRGRLDLSRSISDIVSLENVRVGIEKLERQDGNPIRILVKP